MSSSSVLLPGGVVLNCDFLVFRCRNLAAFNLLSVLPSLGLPSHRLPRVADFLVQLLYLLKGEALSLVDHEVDEEDADEAGGEPHEEDFRLQVGVSVSVVNEVRGRVSDSPVQKPVSRRSNTKGLCAGLKGVDLASNDPGKRTPSRGKEEDIDAGKGNSSLLPTKVLHEYLPVIVLARRHRTADSDN